MKGGNDKENLCPKMAAQASERVPVLALGLFHLLLPALLPTRTNPGSSPCPALCRAKSAKYAEVEVYKLSPLFVLGLRLWRSLSSEPAGVK